MIRAGWNRKYLASLTAITFVGTLLLPATGAQAQDAGLSDSAILSLLRDNGVTTEPPLFDGEQPAQTLRPSLGDDQVTTLTEEPIASAPEDLLEEVVYTSEVVIPDESAGSIEVSSDQGADFTFSMPDVGAAQREELAAGIDAFRHDTDVVSVTVTQTNGVQVVTLITDDSAPTTYSYDLELNGGEAVPVESGAILIFDAEGALEGVFEPAWAYDSAGNSVPTRYELDGSTLTQVVEHDANTSYPVVADPKYTSGVLDKSDVSTYSSKNPGYKVSAWLSAGGRFVLGVDAIAFSTAGWNILKKNHPGYVLHGGKNDPTMKQQWDCHVLGGMLEWGSFDLETGRKSLPNWISRVGTVWPASKVCNW